ncbi:hypothetical protein CAPTEDRAFT_216516 [Capitella teleta]|uniref:Uncharacterized protein n=1 Tax=Capitella teleta TaxID=283909 RepID=R7TKB5_CAPTE|nr:hypothetical protein CAPTEDRAFT_216516 [Capitella teleta]|eukprot:ELT91981.1 hypothetical protein CAPTEDRAFT_216516 [Capitella teleta]
MELSGVMQFDDLIIHEENIQEEAVDLVLKLRPQWKKDEIKVTVFTDGISNKLVGCCLKTDLAKDDLVLGLDLCPESSRWTCRCPQHIQPRKKKDLEEDASFHRPAPVMSEDED